MPRTLMFDSFYNQPKDYYPDNMHPKKRHLPAEIALDNNSLHKILKGNNFLGYWWKYGDTVSIPLTVRNDISVTSRDIILDVEGAEPDLDFAGFIGLRLYNIVDMTSWTLIKNIPSMDSMKYLWKKDPIFKYPTYGEISIKLMPNMAGKKIIALILNFRREEVLRYEFHDVSDCNVIINKDDSNKLLHGVYYLKVSIESDNSLKQVDYYEIHIR